MEEARVAALAEKPLRDAARSNPELNPQDKAAIDKLAAVKGGKAQVEYLNEKDELEYRIEKYRVAAQSCQTRELDIYVKYEDFIIPNSPEKKQKFEAWVKTPDGAKMYDEYCAMEAARDALGEGGQEMKARYKELTGQEYKKAPKPGV